MNMIYVTVIAGHALDMTSNVLTVPDNKQFGRNIPGPQQFRGDEERRNPLGQQDVAERPNCKYIVRYVEAAARLSARFGQKLLIQKLIVGRKCCYECIDAIPLLQQIPKTTSMDNQRFRAGDDGIEKKGRGLSIL